VPGKEEKGSKLHATAEEGHEQATAPPTDNTHTTWATSEEGGREQEVEVEERPGRRKERKELRDPDGRWVSPGKAAR